MSDTAATRAPGGPGLRPKPRLRWWLAALFLVPFGLSFAPGLPSHGYGYVWFLLPAFLWWRRSERRRVIELFALGWVVQTLAYPGPDLGFLGWMLLVPYLLARGRPGFGSWWKAALLYGFFRAHAGFAWLGQVHYSAWIGVSMASGVAFVFAFEGALRALSRLPYAFRVATCWVLFEWVHSWFLGGLPWLQLAHTQYRYGPVIQIAAIFGPFGVSFLLVYVQAAAVRRERMELGVAGVLFLSALCYGLAVKTETADGKKVLMVQTAVRHLVKPDGKRRRHSVWGVLTRLTRAGLKEHPDAALVIWPETMHPGRLVENDPVMSRSFWPAARQMARLHRRPFAYGLNTYTDAEQARAMRGHNSVVLVGADAQLKGIYRKQDLVPMGEEFLPRLVLPAAWCDSLFRWLVENIGYPGNADLEQGEGHATLDAGEGLKGAVLICFEGLDPGFSRAAVRHAPCDFLLHLVNNGWFGVSWEEPQMVAALVFRAVETRTTVLSCANGGITVAIAPSGREIVRLDRVMQDGYLGVLVPQQGAPSLFLRYGFRILLGTILALGTLVLALSRLSKRT